MPAASIARAFCNCIERADRVVHRVIDGAAKEITDCTTSQTIVYQVRNAADGN